MPSNPRAKSVSSRLPRESAANDRTFAGTSWEIYGVHHDDPAQLETTIVYLLTRN